MGNPGVSNMLNEIVIKYHEFNVWELRQELIIVNPLNTTETITVPVGFKSDLASIPRPFWALFPPFGNYIRASIVHDYLIDISTSSSNPTAHIIFYKLMIDDGVHPIISWLFYQIVRFKDFYS